MKSHNLFVHTHDLFVHELKNVKNNLLTRLIIVAPTLRYTCLKYYSSCVVFE